jgi:hypothetical protein
MRAVADLEVPESLRGHHRRCLTAMARLTMATDDSAEPLPEQDFAATAAAAVLAELRAATLVLRRCQAGTGVRSPIVRFLGCRLDRLAIAADDIAAASTVGDLPALRRSVTRFQALTAAMWKVQLAVAAGSSRPRGKRACG